jgi:hypothetical protein
MTAFHFVVEIAAQGIGMEPDGDAVVLHGTIDDDIVNRAKARKPELLEALAIIRDMAGDDWPEVAANPKQLQAFVSSAMIEAMRERGEIPPHYTATTTCKRCGPVPVWPGCPPEVLGCPWCFNRHKGLPIPRNRE